MDSLGDRMKPKEVSTRGVAIFLSQRATKFYLAIQRLRHKDVT